VLHHNINEHGHVPEEVFEIHGFPVDSDKNGKPVRCSAGISQVQLQRAKNLSHKIQKRLRRKRKDEIMRKQQNSSTIKGASFGGVRVLFQGASALLSCCLALLS
jgi:hypothetical protein